MKKLEGKVALITGASRGIGRAVALRYAKEGAQVIITARTIGALEELDDEIKTIGGKATIVCFDITDFSKIDQLGGEISKRFGKLDILVGNAAMLGMLCPVSHIKPSGWEKVFKTNVEANYRLIRSFDSLLRASDYGRAIFVTSSSGERETPYWGAYASSKSALDTIVKTYAREVEFTKVKVNLINPGSVDTAMLKQAMPGLDMTNIKKPNDITDIFVTLCDKNLSETGQVFKIQR